MFKITVVNTVGYIIFTLYSECKWLLADIKKAKRFATYGCSVCVQTIN